MADSDGAEGEGEERRMRGLFLAILFAESLGLQTHPDRREGPWGRGSEGPPSRAGGGEEGPVKSRCVRFPSVFSV